MEGSLAPEPACPKLGEAFPEPLRFQNSCIPISESVHRQPSKRVIVLEPRSRNSKTLLLVDTLVGKGLWKRGSGILRPSGDLVGADLKARPLQFLHIYSGRSCCVLTGDSNNNIVLASRFLPNCVLRTLFGQPSDARPIHRPRDAPRHLVCGVLLGASLI